MERKLKKRKRPLTPKQKKLCHNFVKLNDEEKAYFASGFKGNGNHKAYLRTLFEKPEIQEYIKEIRKSFEVELEDLTDKYRLFVKEYLIDFNASRAYNVTISPDVKGQSLWTAASQLLHTEQIQKALKKEIDVRFERLDIDGDKLVRLLWNIADNDPAVLFDDSDKLESIKDMPIEMRKALRSFKVVENWKKGEELPELTKEVTVCSREKAIELLMKYKGMLIEQHNIRGKIDHNVKAVGVMKVPGMIESDIWQKKAMEWEEHIQNKRLLEENDTNGNS